MRKIRLNESQFNRLVSKCVKRALCEAEDSVLDIYINNIFLPLKEAIDEVYSPNTSVGYGSSREYSGWRVEKVAGAVVYDIYFDDSLVAYITKQNNLRIVTTIFNQDILADVICAYFGKDFNRI